jgi:ammonium transporter, Amt family
MSDILAKCLMQEGEGVSDRILLQCALTEMNNLNVAQTTSQNSASRQVAVILGASMVFFMQAGFAMVCAGSVRRKNVQNTMLKNLLDACSASVAFFAIGFALAFGGSDPTSPTKTFIGTSNFFLHGIEDYSFWIFQYAFSAASATIVAGALSERCQMTAYVAYSVVLTGLVYPVVAHAIWDAQGFLSAINVKPLFDVGLIDFAGSGVVHVTGGVTSLIAAAIIGPRRGRYVRQETKKKTNIFIHSRPTHLTKLVIGPVIFYTQFP